MITFKEFMMNESINDKGILKALFVVGIPGAGKSYTVSKLHGTISPKVVNTDIATEFLSKKYKMPSNNETWKSFFRDRTRPITSTSLFNYLNSMLPLFVDGTSNDASNILARAGLLESVGYDVGMVFINVNLDVAIERAKARGAAIDRHVDEDFIKKVYAESEVNKEYFKGKFDFFREVSNNDGELDNDAIQKIFKQVSGFYNEAVDNPVGIRTLEKLTAAKGGYLIPEIFNEADLKKKAEGWYRS